MNYRNPELQRRLAADYVSGVLRGGARRRFESLLPYDAALRREVHEWEETLHPLIWSLPPLAPPARVWRAIRARIPHRAAVSPWSWNGLYLWRSASAVLAVLMAVGLAMYPQQVDRAAREQLLAVLQTPEARAALVVRADADGTIHVRALDNFNGLAAGKSLELWAIPPGQKPQSMGLVAASGATDLVRPRGLKGVEQLAVTLEPAGGAPNGVATGPIVMSGKVLEL